MAVPMSHLCQLSLSDHDTDCYFVTDVHRIPRDSFGGPRVRDPPARTFHRRERKSLQLKVCSSLIAKLIQDFCQASGL